MWEKLQFETIEKLKQLAHAASQPVRVHRATARLRLERMSRQVAQG
jgi:hypothetical protein